MNTHSIINTSVPVPYMYDQSSPYMYDIPLQPFMASTKTSGPAHSPQNPSFSLVVNSSHLPLAFIRIRYGVPTAASPYVARAGISHGEALSIGT